MLALNAMPEDSVALSIEETIQTTRYSRAGIYSEINSGRLRSYKVGKRRFVSRKALDEWIQAMEDATQFQGGDAA